MSRTIRNKTFLPSWLFTDVDIIVFTDGEEIFGIHKVFQEDIPKTIRDHQLDKYKPGRRNHKPKALRQYEDKKHRLKTRKEMLKLFGDIDYPVDSRTKSKLPYWD